MSRKSPRSRDHAEPWAPSAPSRSALGEHAVEALDAVRLVVRLARRGQEVARLRVEDQDEPHDNAGRGLEERGVGLVVIELLSGARICPDRIPKLDVALELGVDLAHQQLDGAAHLFAEHLREVALTVARGPDRLRQSSGHVGCVCTVCVDQRVQPAERLAALALVKPGGGVPLGPRVVVRARVDDAQLPPLVRIPSGTPVRRISSTRRA